MTGPIKKMQPQQRLQIREGMTVEEVKKYGSEGQKLAACLFDTERTKDANGEYVKDGIYSKAEAARFNDFNFSVRDNVFTMYDRYNNQTTEIKYKNPDDLKKLLNAEYNEPNILSFYPDNKKQKVYCGDSFLANGKTTLDLQEGIVTIDGADGDFVATNGKKAIIKNSNISKISTSAEELEIQNTREKGLLWDSPTKVEAGKETKVKIDNNSDVELEREEK